MAVVGLLLLVAGVLLMASSRRLARRDRRDDTTGPLALAWFFLGCALVAAAGVLITAWYVRP